MPAKRSVCRDYETIHAVKGGGMPLTPAQRELVAIFVEYLQRLPLSCCETDAWQKAPELFSVRHFVRSHFRRLYPSWEADEDGQFHLCDLSAKAASRYEWLITNACNPRDAFKSRMERETNLKSARSIAASYQQQICEMAMKYGVSRDELLSEAETPIERIAAAAFRQNQVDTGSELDAG